MLNFVIFVQCLCDACVGFVQVFFGSKSLQLLSCAGCARYCARIYVRVCACVRSHAHVHAYV